MSSNLLTHLKRHHQKQYTELIEAQEKKIKREKIESVLRTSKTESCRVLNSKI